MNDDDLVFRYTRAQAIADGVQVDVSELAREAGIKFPVFLTRAVFDKYVTVPLGVTGQDEAGRLWDVVWLLRMALVRATSGENRLPFALYVREVRGLRLVKLIAYCGPLDFDKPEPALTVTAPDED